MKVKTLINKLQKLNPEADVIVSSDMEGNSYGLLNELSSCLYHNPAYSDAEYSYQGGIELLDQEDIDSGEIISTKVKKAVVLWPNC